MISSRSGREGEEKKFQSHREWNPGHRVRSLVTMGISHGTLKVR